MYRSLVGEPNPALAEEARTRLAGLLFSQGRFADAAEAVQPLTSSVNPLHRHRAAFLLGEVGRANKDCQAATSHYQLIVSEKAVLEPYARLGLIACAEITGDSASVIEHAQAMVDADLHRRLRIEALEKLAAAELRRGNPDRYLQIYKTLYSLGVTPSYRGTVLFGAAEVAEIVGDQAGVIERLSTLVREYPEHPRASTALDKLNAMQAADSVTWAQAALVRLNAGRTQAATEGFEASLAEAPDGPEAATARYNLAVLRLRQGYETAAAEEMRATAERFPNSAIAPAALLRAGRIIESNDGLEDARHIYAQLASVYPSTNQGRNGRFRLGLVYYIRGDFGSAASAWEPLAQDSAERDLQSLALFWQGKAYQQLGNPADADARFARAVELGPDTFGGFRAQVNRAGESRPTHGFQPFALPPAQRERFDAELDDWLAAQGVSHGELADVLAGEPMYQRAIELTRLGMREQALIEFDGLAAQAGQATPAAPRQYLLAATQMNLGYTSQALRTAEMSAREQGVPRTALPTAFQKLMMPLAFDEQLIGGANRHGVDAMLFAALVRQESRFDPAARSTANALGLSQVVPATGRTIADALGHADFREADLLKPAVNLDFGAYFLAGQLNRYGGQMLPALAAYNAGGGAVDRWLNQYGRVDMDLFAERIPYVETNHYLHVVYENYNLYKRIYQAEG